MKIKPTHYLLCSHVIGSNHRSYNMPCIILKILSNNMLKVRVFGDRDIPGTLDKSRVKRVAKYRVKFIPRS